MINYQVTQFGHDLTLSEYQVLLNPGDKVLWVCMPVEPTFNDIRDPEIFFLKVSPTAITVKKNKGFIVTAIDGRTGNAPQNATVGGVKTDAAGKATIYHSKTGFFQYKASREPDVRSNVISITVTN